MPQFLSSRVYFKCVTHLAYEIRFQHFSGDCHLNRLSHRRFHFQLLNIYCIIVMFVLFHVWICGNQYLPRTDRETEKDANVIPNYFLELFVSFYVCGACKHIFNIFSIPNHYHFDMKCVCWLMIVSECGHTLYAPQ